MSKVDLQRAAFYEASHKVVGYALAQPLAGQMLTATVGLQDMVVVETKDAVL